MTGFIAAALHVAMVALIVIAVLFALTFIVYLFNLDMKLTAALQPFFERHYDKMERDQHL